MLSGCAHYRKAQPFESWFRQVEVEVESQPLIIDGKDLALAAALVACGEEPKTERATCFNGVEETFESKINFAYPYSNPEWVKNNAKLELYKPEMISKIKKHKVSHRRRNQAFIYLYFYEHYSRFSHLARKSVETHKSHVNEVSVHNSAEERRIQRALDRFASAVHQRNVERHLENIDRKLGGF